MAKALQLVGLWMVGIGCGATILMGFLTTIWILWSEYRESGNRWWAVGAAVISLSLVGLALIGITSVCFKG